MAPVKKSPIWEFFKVSDQEPSDATCLVVGCKSKKVSRGKVGGPRSKLSNSPMVNHLSNHHPKEYRLFCDNKAVCEKRKVEEEENNNGDEDLENCSVPVFDLNVHKKRQKFLQQSITGWFNNGASVAQSEGTTCSFTDDRAKQRHKGVLIMVIMDLHPWTIVNPGYIYNSYQLDPYYKVGSRKFYCSGIMRRGTDKFSIKITVGVVASMKQRG